MRKKLIGLSFLVVALSAGQAMATPYIATEAEPEKPKVRRNQATIGMHVGGSDIGDVSGPGVGLHTTFGRRFGTLTLLGEYSYLSVGESAYDVQHRRGNMSRLGLTARYSVLTTGESEKSSLGADVWVEAGGGRHRVAWHEGGTLTRNDVVLGFGVQMNVKLNRKSPKPRHFGPYFAFRAHMARAPESDEPAVCGGPCDNASAPSRNDVSIFFNVGLHWGK
jgi:hypothetical protein